MIPNNTKATVTEQNLGTVEKKELGVDPTAMAHIMYLLTNLYSDEELACIREYSTNAWDSHIVAGQTRPIEVSTPSNLVPTLRIRDFGTGLNKEDIFKTFALYGASTKREDERQNGAMGIGGKSALAYGSSFTVTGVKDGMKTVVMVSRDDDGSASATIMLEAKSSDPNGVEISIPVQPYNGFINKARDFFKFWAPGTVLLDGVEPDRSDMEQISDRIWLHDGDHDLIVMGNVAYPLDYLHPIRRGNRHVAAYVTMNGDDEVVFTPAREGLIYNGITDNALKGLREELDGAIYDFVKNKVEAADSFIDAYRIWNECNSEFSKVSMNDIKYNDLSLTNDLIKFDDGEILYGTMWHPGRARNSVSRNKVFVGTLATNSSLVVTGYNGSGVSSAHKTRVKQYCRENGVTLETGYYSKSIVFVATNALPEPEKTSGFKTVDWKTILTATKKPKSSTAGTGFSYGETYDVYYDGGWKTEELDEDDEILFYTPKDVYFDRDLVKKIVEENPDVKFVSAYTNRHGKLQRVYKNAKPFQPHVWYRKFADENFDTLTEDELEGMRIRRVYQHRWFNNEWVNAYVDEIPTHLIDDIQDEELRRIARLYNTPAPVVRWLDQSEKYRKVTAGWDNKDFINWEKRYPLSNWSEYSNQTLEYINAIHDKEN